MRARAARARRAAGLAVVSLRAAGAAGPGSAAATSVRDMRIVADMAALARSLRVFIRLPPPGGDEPAGGPLTRHVEAPDHVRELTGDGRRLHAHRRRRRRRPELVPVAE